MQSRKENIEAVRRFNRFYTNVAGWLDRHLHDTGFSLPEARVLYEVYHRSPCTASDILQLLRMDKGYLSRVLTSLENKKLLSRAKSRDDGRASLLTITSRGTTEFKKLNQASIDDVAAILQSLSQSETDELLHSMERLMIILAKTRVYEKA